MCISKLIFFSNELQNTHRQREMRVPLEFVSFAFIEAKMYKHFKNQSTFTLPIKRSWGNDVVYGGIFLLQDYDFYIRLLDAYHTCSKSILRRNHDNDIHHRITTQATPISFNTLDELSHLKYKEIEPIKVNAYMGNQKHPKINQRLNKTVSYRIVEGIDKENFKKQFGRKAHE